VAGGFNGTTMRYLSAHSIDVYVIYALYVERLNIHLVHNFRQMTLSTHIHTNWYKSTEDKTMYGGRVGKGKKYCHIIKSNLLENDSHKSELMASGKREKAVEKHSNKNKMPKKSFVDEVKSYFFRGKERFTGKIRVCMVLYEVILRQVFVVKVKGNYLKA
jgi:hypothetical protein